MKQMHIPHRLVLSGSVAAAVFAVAVLAASAQTATTSPDCSTSPNSTNKANAGNLTSKTAGSATAQMMQEACQRQRARTRKFLQCGIPEMFGSEEPFKFDASVACQ